MIEYPTPSQLLTKLLDMINDKNEPGPGTNPLTLWDTDGLKIEAVRKTNEYAIRLKACEIQSRPVLYFRSRWHIAPQSLDIVSHWLTVVQRKLERQET